MTAGFVLTWSFTPPDMFEDEVRFGSERRSFTVGKGTAEARVSADAVTDVESLRTELHEELDARFLAAQVLGHRPYTLSKPSLLREHPDGRRDAWILAEPAVIKISTGNVDFVVHDAAGNVTRDTRRERIDHRKVFADRAAMHIVDPVLNAVLRSYSAAVADPRNELVHLYEIREGLATHFGGQRPATHALGITGTTWSTLGRIVNEEPLRQGRHRGKQLGALRDATEAELKEARSIARDMIEAYLTFLRNKSEKP